MLYWWGIGLGMFCLGEAVLVGSVFRGGIVFVVVWDLEELCNLCEVYMLDENL